MKNSEKLIIGAAGAMFGATATGLLVDFYLKHKAQTLKLSKATETQPNVSNENAAKYYEQERNSDNQFLDVRKKPKRHYDYFGDSEGDFSQDDYEEYMELLKHHYDKAVEQMELGNFNYALYEIRLIIEVSLRLLISHKKGIDEVHDRMCVNLKICEHTNLLDQSLINRLHRARKICNANGHELVLMSDPSLSEVEYAIEQAKSLIVETTNILSTA